MFFKAAQMLYDDITHKHNRSRTQALNIVSKRLGAISYCYKSIVKESCWGKS